MKDNKVLGIELLIKDKQVLNLSMHCADVLAVFFLLLHSLPVGGVTAPGLNHVWDANYSHQYASSSKVSAEGQ